jgi:hypothetical protein
MKSALKRRKGYPYGSSPDVIADYDKLKDE